MYNLETMEFVKLTEETPGIWVSASGNIEVRKQGKELLLTTPRVKEYAMVYDTRPGFKHWVTEISFGGADQWLVFIEKLTPTLKMYWENSY